MEVAAPPAARRSQAPEEEKPQRGPTEYLVFEAPKQEVSAGDSLRFVARVTADSKKDARWAAVDKDEQLKGRVVYNEKENPEPKPAFLVAIAVRNGHPEETVEQAEVTRTRR